MDDLQVFTYDDSYLATVGVLGIAYNVVTGKVICHIMTGTADKRSCMTWKQLEANRKKEKINSLRRKRLATRNCP